MKNKIKNNLIDVVNRDYDYENMIDYLTILCFNSETNIDYLNNRFQLCKAMKGFPSICEGKTRTLVPLFFRFLK